MIERLGVYFFTNPRKVVLLYLDLGLNRMSELADRIARLDPHQNEALWKEISSLFKHRHRYFESVIDLHAQKAEKTLNRSFHFHEVQRKLFGAYLSKEYSTQSAALFNPSIVAHPNQGDLPDDSLRFILSLRATGEGHISSICFREGRINPNGLITMDQDTLWQSTGMIPGTQREEEYGISFKEKKMPLQERILFPVSKSESMGMEDLRLVDFRTHGLYRYAGTFTAYDGLKIQSKLLLTNDFEDFKIQSLTGAAIRGKGIAFFPRKIGQNYVAIGRQDGVNISIMYSDRLSHWERFQVLQEPEFPFEFTQLGNCGSPIETQEGWLLITHAVGPLRRYVLGATLLDLDDPSKIRGKLDIPLLEPTEEEREGYVPNVLYSCGSLLFRDHLYIPYAFSDQGCTFGKVQIDDLLYRILQSPK